MKSLKLIITSVLSIPFLFSCATPDYDPSVSPARPYVPRVTMPVDLNANARNLIGDVEQTLEQSGLRPTDREGAEYQLAFSVEDGPVNADVTLDLYQGRNRVAHAYARVGGPRIVFQRQRVIREAFDKALQQFEAQLPRTGGSGSAGMVRPPSGRYSDGYDNPSPQPDPYGTPRPYYDGGADPSREY